MVYIDWRNSQSPGALEDRVRRLEARVAALTEALRVLAHGLQDLPATGPAGEHAAEAARQAYDLLPVTEPHAPRGQLPAAAGDDPGRRAVGWPGSRPVRVPDLS